jgi:hypothetical protein
MPGGDNYTVPIPSTSNQVSTNKRLGLVFR